MFIDELRQSVGSVNMIKRGDRFDRYPAIVSLRFTNGRIKFDTKAAQISKKKYFRIKIESEAEGLSRPKSIGISTVLRCISCPDLVILA